MNKFFGHSIPKITYRTNLFQYFGKKKMFIGIPISSTNTNIQYFQRSVLSSKWVKFVYSTR